MKILHTTRLGTDGTSAVTERKKWLLCSARGRVWVRSYSDPPALAIKKLFVPKMQVSDMLKNPPSGASIKSGGFQDLVGPFQLEMFHNSVVQGDELNLCYLGHQL